MKKKLLYSLLVALCGLQTTYAQEATLRLADSAGGCALTIGAQVAGQYVSFQMDIVAPGDCRLEKAESVAAYASLNLQAATLQNGLVRVAAYADNALRLEFDGSDVFAVQFQGVPANASTFTLKNIRFAAADGTETLLPPVSVTYQGTSPQPTPYDLNGDGAVNVGDVTTLVNMILGKTALLNGADLNSDGSVNVGDVTTLVNRILGK